MSSSTSSYRPIMLLIEFCNNDHVLADLEVAEERSPAMTDSSEGEVDLIHSHNYLDDLGDIDDQNEDNKDDFEPDEQLSLK